MKTNISKTGLLLIMGILFISCSNDDDATKPITPKTENNYMLVTSVDAGGGSAYSYYIQPVKGLSDKTGYVNADAIELFTNGYAGIYNHKNNIYVNQYVPDQNIFKWELNDDGSYKKTGTVNVAELSYQGNLIFKDDNTAFVGGVGNKIVILNPTTMEKTGFIDLTDISRVGEVTNYPKEGDKINLEVFTDLIIRDNVLFAAVGYISDFTSYTPASTTADFIAIDLNKVNVNGNNKSEVVINSTSSDKGAAVGGWNSGWGVPFMNIDEKGDLYIMCHNFWGATKTGKNACMLRIKKGETKFDPNYYFDLESAAKGTGNPVVNFNYYKDGIFFGIANDISRVDPNNPWSYYIDDLAQWYKFDLYNKKATLVDAAYTKGVYAAKVHFESGKAYIPYQTKAKDYVIETDVNTLESKTIFTTEGAAEIIQLKK